ncbi:hypothetical protein FRB99_001540 [Tulasnella sp. 403]|nr:hypothetical protein FRB99_001540 [Tulasnella sp. 403]
MARKASTAKTADAATAEASGEAKPAETTRRSNRIAEKPAAATAAAPPKKAAPRKKRATEKGEDKSEEPPTKKAKPGSKAAEAEETKEVEKEDKDTEGQDEKMAEPEEKEPEKEKEPEEKTAKPASKAPASAGKPMSKAKKPASTRGRGAKAKAAAKDGDGDTQMQPVEAIPEEPHEEQPKQQEEEAAEDKENHKAEESKAFDIGDALPDLTLKNEKDEDVSIAKLAEEKGVVIFIVPKADTPGCNTQACGFRDSYAEFETLGYAKNLPYSLISDPKRQLIGKLGASARNNAQTKRSHFIFEKGTGKLLDKKISVKPADSPSSALEFLKKHHAEAS